MTCVILAALFAAVAPEKALLDYDRRLREAKGSAAVSALVSEAFDFDELARRSLGDAWTAQPKKEREKFAKLLRAVIEASYLPKVRETPDHVLDVKSVERAGEEATVHTIGKAKENSLPLDFRLRLEGARWRIYDTVIDGVGLVETYNEQFTKVLAKSGWSGLLKALETRKAALDSEKKSW